jgi:dethiobiotin synthetase
MTLRGVFVAGTDTGVGKTFVSAGLAAAAVAEGRRLAVMKPVAAGADETPDGLRNDDALALIAAARSTAPYEDVNPYCLPIAASPHIAAAAAGRRIETDVVLGAARRLTRAGEWLLVEGAGGWQAPIGARETMADLARALGLPVLLVVGLRLGCLNHAQLTHDAIRRDGLRFAGWIGNVIDPAMPHLDANLDWLRERFGDAFALLPWQPPDRPGNESPAARLATASRRLAQL